MKKTLSKNTVSKSLSEGYGGLIGGIAELLQAARRNAARAVNALMTATYGTSAGALWSSNSKARRAPAMENKFFPSFRMI
jgi:hypothetical protein